MRRNDFFFINVLDFVNKRIRIHQIFYVPSTYIHLVVTSNYIILL